MDRLQRLLHPGMGGEGPPGDSAQVDTSEQVYISSLALIKMLKHGEFQTLLILGVFRPLSLTQIRLQWDINGRLDHSWQSTWSTCLY